MGAAVPPLPQYAFVAWFSVRGSTRDSFLVPNQNDVHLQVEMLQFRTEPFFKNVN
jgi:hypothetical protein